MTRAIADDLVEIFPGDSEMSRQMRARDWSDTPLGDPRSWPDALKIPLRMLLTSRFEMWLGWGPELCFFYNDAYIPTLGIKHPVMLGRPFREVWAEVYEDVADQVARVRAGEATWNKALMLLLERSGYPEETYHTFSYSPLIGDDGTVQGLMCVVTEETERVISERRLRLLHEMSVVLLATENVTAVRDTVVRTLAGHGRDFPFADLIVFAGEGREPAGSAHDVAWPIASVLGDNRQGVIPLDGLFADPPKGEWDIAPREALIVAIRTANQAAPVGALVLGINPYRPLDEATRDFGRLLSRQIAGALVRMEAASAQRREVSWLRDLFSQTPSFIAVLHGPEHRFEFVNDSYLQLIAHRDVIGLPIRAALPEIAGQGLFELLDKVYATGEAFIGQSVPVSLRRAANAEPETRVLDFVYQPIRGDGGDPIGIFVEGIDVTAASDTVTALRESEAKFRTFAQAVPTQIWTALPSGLLDWFNDGVFDYSGLDFEALAGEGWVQIVHPDDIEPARSKWAEALSSGSILETEIRIRRHDGEYRWHLVRALAIRNDAGELTRWLGTNTDINDQKMSEVETLRDRDRLWTLSQDLMLISDLTGVVKSVNPSATRMLGWAEDEMAGRTFAEFVHPDDLADTEKELARLAQGISTLSFENRYRRKDGEYRLLAWNAVPDAGHIHGVARDITDERKLARDRERVWELSPVVKVVADTDGTILAINPSWTATLGWTEAETVGRNALEFIAEDVEAARGRLAKLATTTDRFVESRSVFKARDGSNRRFAWTAVPEGGIIYLFGRDVTAEYEAAEALASAEEALRQSHKMEAVGQLTGGIAHDFNNLLAGILGSLEVLEQRIAQGRLEAIPGLVESARGAASRAAALTQRLLAFSRRQTLDPKPVDVHQLAVGLEDLLRRTVGPGIDMELVGSAGLWPTLVDRYQLENAILNLCINARDAMPDGGRLTIQTANKHLDDRAARDIELPPGDYVLLSVADTGAGMSPDVSARAFDPFFTTKPLGEGTGLGLSMIYGFVRQSGGQVRINSIVETGTTMNVYLPRHRGALDEAEAEDEAAQHGADGHGETILVVDDEALVRMLVVDVLEESGYQVIEAGDGPSALAMLESDRRIDLLVSDVGLPGGMNGRQVADAARVRRPDLKVLFITGYAEGTTVGTGLAGQGMQVITKPFTMEALGAKVRDMLDEAAAT